VLRASCEFGRREPRFSTSIRRFSREPGQHPGGNQHDDLRQRVTVHNPGTADVFVCPAEFTAAVADPGTSEAQHRRVFARASRTSI
jgi:hypothetical protein